MMRVLCIVVGAVVISASALDCTAVPAPGSPHTAHPAALINGAPSDPESDGVVRVIADVECSGFLITNQWAITARHCVSSALAAQPQQITVFLGGTRVQPAQMATVTEVHRSAAGPDLALLHLSVPLNVNGAPSGYLQREYPTSNNPGQSFTCTGWGAAGSQNPRPDGPNSALLLLGSISPPLLGFRPPVLGQQDMATGDAGGPCIGDLVAWRAAIGLIGGVYTDGTGAAIDLTAPAIRSWMESVLVQVDPEVPAQAASIPFAISPDGQQINIFWVDDLGQMNQSQLSPDAPSVVIGASEDDPFAAARPAAVYLRGDLHILGTTVSGGVLEGVSSGGAGVSTWSGIDMPAIASGLGISSQGADAFDVFARSVAGPVAQAFFVARRWFPYELIGGSFDEDVLPLWSQSDNYGNSIHVFGVSQGHVGHKWQRDTDAYWQPAGDDWLFGDVTGNVASAISTVQIAELTMDLFARGTNGHLVHKGYANGFGDEFADMGVAIPGEPTAVAAGGTIHIFARNPSGTLWHAHYPR